MFGNLEELENAMQRNQAKFQNNIQPNVHFVWFGAWKPISIEGPISLANATNEIGKSYSIIYWVEEFQLLVATASFSNHSNVEIRCIDNLITLYCQGDVSKEKMIQGLLEKCRIENLPTVAKEILAPIILSLNSGYFFDTSISATKITNLTPLTQPALSRLFITPEPDELVYLQNEFSLKLADTSQKYISTKNRFNRLYNYPTSSDLFAFYSAANLNGEITQDSEKLFNLLANKTIALWEEFFYSRRSLERYCAWPVNEIMRVMINRTLIGAITEVYESHEALDDETILVVKNQNNIKQVYNLVDSRNSSLSKCMFTTIDAIPVDEKPISIVRRKLFAPTKPALRELFIDGKETGITKMCRASWKNNNFKVFIERQIKPYQESSCLPSFLSNNRYALFKSASVLGLAIAGGLAVANFIYKKNQL